MEEEKEKENKPQDSAEGPRGEDAAETPSTEEKPPAKKASIDITAEKKPRRVFSFPFLNKMTGAQKASNKAPASGIERALRWSWVGFLTLLLLLIVWLAIVPAPSVKKTAPDAVPILSLGFIQDKINAGLKGLSSTTSPPYKRFAQPLEAAKQGAEKKIAIIIYGLGMREDLTKEAIYNTPAGVTLAFSPYAQDLDKLQQEAYSQGHEVMMQLPLEPLTFPEIDPGPATLLTNAKNDENKKKLGWLMAKMRYAVGVVAQYGSRFLTSQKDVLKLLGRVNESGFLFIDNNDSLRSATPALAAEVGIPYGIAFKSLSAETPPEKINEVFKNLKSETEGRKNILLILQASPVSLQLLKTWITSTAFYPMALVPVSAVVEKTDINQPTQAFKNDHLPKEKK